MIQAFLADSAIDLYASRLMVLHAAWKVENGLPHRQEVAMVKTFVSEAFGRVADRAVQIHGAAGIAMDLPIARIYQDARAARIYDGASEVHRMTIARELLKLAMNGESTRQACWSAYDARSTIAPDDIVRTPEEGAANEREPLLVLEPLQAFLDEHGLGAGELRVEPVGDGHSNVTYAIARDDGRGRRPPPAARPAAAQRARRAARGARAAARSQGKARVPKVLAVSEGGVIGCPFYVMERVQGHVDHDRGAGRARQRRGPPPDGRGARRRARRGARDRLAGRGARGLRQADRLPRAPAQALPRALGAQQDARDPRGRDRRATG